MLPGRPLNDRILRANHPGRKIIIAVCREYPFDGRGVLPIVDPADSVHIGLFRDGNSLTDVLNFGLEQQTKGDLRLIPK